MVKWLDKCYFLTLDKFSNFRPKMKTLGIVSFPNIFCTKEMLYNCFYLDVFVHQNSEFSIFWNLHCLRGLPVCVFNLIFDISKFRFNFSVILWLKFDQTPLVNTFYCVFKKEFFKRLQKSFICQFFYHWKKLQNSVFSSFWNLQFFIFVEEVCPHPPHEYFLLCF